MTDFIDPDFTITSAAIAEKVYGIDEGLKDTDALQRVALPRGGRYEGCLAKRPCWQPPPTASTPNRWSAGFGCWKYFGCSAAAAAGFRSGDYARHDRDENRSGAT